jgi:DNA-binding CsgD family transcriptional regulator
LGSAERLIFEELGIGLPADDSPTRQRYARHVRRFLRDPILVDRLVAVVATVGVEAEVWLGGGTHGHPLPFALLGPLVTLPVAVRRRWPLQVALLATTLDALATGLWGPPEVVSFFVAWAFALYGLAVWTGTREFVEEFVRRSPVEPQRTDAVEQLTRREREVFDLLVRGLSNPQICERLVVSEATTKTHVARILQKLGLRDRIQAVIFAYESGLVTPGTTDNN